MFQPFLRVSARDAAAAFFAVSRFTGGPYGVRLELAGAGWANALATHQTKARTNRDFTTGCADIVPPPLNFDPATFPGKVLRATDYKEASACCQEAVFVQQIAYGFISSFGVGICSPQQGL